MTDLREQLIEAALPGVQAWGQESRRDVAAWIVDAVLSALPRLTEEECEAVLCAVDHARSWDEALDDDQAREVPSSRPARSFKAGAILPERITEEMVERAARALWGVVATKDLGQQRPFPYDRLVAVTTADLADYARAALEAALTVPSQPTDSA